MNEITINVSQQFQQEFEEALIVFAKDILERIDERDLYERKWMNQKEACEWLNISYGTLQKWRKRGLQMSIIDGKTMISKKDINHFLESHRY